MGYRQVGLLLRAHPPVVPDTHRWVIDRWVTDRWASSHVPTRQWFLTHTGGLHTDRWDIQVGHRQVGHTSRSQTGGTYKWATDRWDIQVGYRQVSY